MSLYSCTEYKNLSNRQKQERKKKTKQLMRFPASSRDASIPRMWKLKYSELKTRTITTLNTSLSSTVKFTVELVPNRNVSGGSKKTRWEGRDQSKQFKTVMYLHSFESKQVKKEEGRSIRTHHDRRYHEHGQTELLYR